MRGDPQAGPRLLGRIRGALERRAKAAWRRVVGGRTAAAEAALERLKRCVGRDTGLSPTCGTSAVCPGLTAAAVPTFWNFGETDLALSFARRLLAMQRADGSLPDAGLLHVSLFNTAQAARAWRTLLQAGELAEAETALRRACTFLDSRIQFDGALRLPVGGGSFERWASPAAQLAGFAEMIAGAERYRVPSWRTAIARAAERACRLDGLDAGDAPLHIAAHGIESMLDLAEVDPRCGRSASMALEQLAARQRPDGSLSADHAHGWTSAVGLAHIAALWFRAGITCAGRRAMECLTAHQRADGAWPGSWGRGAAYFPNGCSTWTAKYFLDASLAQVEAAFATSPNELLAPLSAEDQRRRALERIAAEVVRERGDRAEVVDVGCGSGRLLAPLLKLFPRIRLIGVDPSQKLLEHVPQGVEKVVGGLLRLPRGDESCDIACCVEALEHALAPRRAVDELCRVVRPGGRVVVIDKDARFQSLSEVEPWERWFTPESISGWLAKHCDRVTCEPLPPGPQQRTTGLFLCWTGVKRRSGRIDSVRRAA